MTSAKLKPGFFGNVFSCLERVFKRVCFGRVLLRLYENIALIAAVRKNVKYRAEVYRAVTGNRERSEPHAFKEAEVFLLNLIYYLGANIL